MPRIHVRLTLPAAATLLCLLSLPASADRLDEQRDAFRAVLPQAELGIWDLTPSQQALLEDYVLWPDLRAAWLRARLATAGTTEIDAFLEQYEPLKPARALRYRYALQLAKDGNVERFLDIYDRHYRGLDVARLDCLALQLSNDAGQGDPLPRARELWLVGHSQAEECDPVFDHLRESGQLDETLYRERYELAIEARSLSLARYLARSLPDGFRADASNWSAAYGEPGKFLDGHEARADNDTHRRQLIAAIEMLSYDQPDAAAKHWDRLRSNYRFSADQRTFVARHIALWMARNHRSDSQAFLDALPDAAVDAEVLRWRVRDALRRHDWPSVVTAVQALPDEERQSDQWQYWRGIALAGQGKSAAGLAILQRIAAERSYYGFLAADELRVGYAWSHQALAADDAIIQALAGREDLVRARELFRVGLEGRGRSEWDTAVGQLDPAAQVQAAILAGRWGWHSRAIATAAMNERYDDLNLRYPLAYASQFEQYANDAGIAQSWAYGIARSESLFMRDIRSGAGAIGIMQLMPSTARRTARLLRQPYDGLTTLTDAGSNIRLGTSFLAEMYDRFDNHRVLATAAYNAGPLRVERWLPQGREIDARIWIETIPFQETRDYVRRVLAADTIFHWRLAGETRRMSAALVPVSAAPRLARLSAE